MVKGNWQRYTMAGGEVVNLRVEERGGRFVITDLRLQGDNITSATLRTLPVGRWEAQANAYGGYLQRVRTDRSPADDRPPLTRPSGSEPDAFYQGVAAAYREYVVQTTAVGVRIAEEAGVPVTTAHRWIREARRRGYLPAGKQGKAT